MHPSRMYNGIKYDIDAVQVNQHGVTCLLLRSSNTKELLGWVDKEHTSEVHE